MFSKISMVVMLASAIFLAPMRLPASCILSTAPSEKACAPRCCASKACCETSKKNTAPPVQPFAKSGSDQQNIVTLPATVTVATLPQTATLASHILSSAVGLAHSPTPLALICIRLI